MKRIEVSVIYRGSKNPRVSIELTPRVAEMLTDGHQNTTDVIFDDIRKSIQFIHESATQDKEH